MSTSVRAPRHAATVMLVALALLAAIATIAVVAARGNPRARTQAQQVQQIAASLHCPICKDLSVADSPAPLAQQMRAQIAEQLAAGETADQIRAGFVAAYGDSVLMAPPRHGLSGAAYYLPGMVVLLAAAVATLVLRRWRRASRSPNRGDDPPKLSAAQRRAVQRAVERLRDEEPG